jgi:hypothetical protein
MLLTCRGNRDSPEILKEAAGHPSSPQPLERKRLLSPALCRSPEITAIPQRPGGFQSESRAPTSGSEGDPLTGLGEMHFANASHFQKKET